MWRSDPTGDRGPRAYQPEFTWIPLLIVVGLVAQSRSRRSSIARRRHRLRTEDDAVAAEQVAGLLHDGLDDLRAERDPRRAVIAAYARLEQALGTAGLPRRLGRLPRSTSREFSDGSRSTGDRSRGSPALRRRPSSRTTRRRGDEERGDRALLRHSRRAPSRARAAEPPAEHVPTRWHVVSESAAPS